MSVTFSPAAPSAQVRRGAGCPSPSPDLRGGRRNLPRGGRNAGIRPGERHIDAASARVEVDLAAVRSMDCRGITVLVTVRRVATRAATRAAILVQMSSGQQACLVERLWRARRDQPFRLPRTVPELCAA